MIPAGESAEGWCLWCILDRTAGEGQPDCLWVGLCGEVNVSGDGVG